MAISYKRSGVRYDKSHQDRTRQKIADARVIDRLLKCYNGELKLDASQVAIGLSLLKKLVPDLASQEVTLDTLQPFAVIPQQMDSSEAWERAQQAPAPKPDRPKPGTTKH